MAAERAKKSVNALVLLFLGLNWAFWLGTSDVFAKWDGVPPVPTHDGAMIMALGDTQFAYRFGAITLQSLGDEGGHTTPLKDYSYEMLHDWFWVLYSFDPLSDHVPMVAAYYFGATRTPSDVKYIVEYLGRIGQSPYGRKWRWLVQAIVLAYHNMHDKQLALDLSYKLAGLKLVDDTLPEWARRMPAFILAEKGDTKAARKIVEDMLLNRRQGYHPEEINAMKAFLVEQLAVDPAEVDEIIALRGKDVAEPPAKPLPPQQPE
jgi:hypothetical protein